MLRRRTPDPLWPFLGFLLLVGILDLSDPRCIYLRTLVFCLHFTIYTGLLLFWIQSLRERLLPSRTRRYLLLSAMFMILYLLIQLIKYRVIPQDSPATRWLWYGYYLPMLMIPTFFLLGCIYTGDLPRRAGATDLLLLLPPLGLSALVLANDAHHLAFRPLPGFEAVFERSGTYSYGPLYYACCVWIALTVTAGVVFLIAASRRFRKKAVLPLLCIAVIPVFVLIQQFLAVNGLNMPYQLPELIIFSMLGVFECCIRIRLIPHNDNYPEFFKHMRIPAVITDSSLAPVYQTAVPMDVSVEQLREALDAPVYTDECTLLSGIPVTGGFAFWTEDESELHRMNRQLEDANETLATETELLRAEHALREEMERVESRSRIYRSIAEEMYPAQKRIEELLSGAVPGDPSFPEVIRDVALLNAYVKRKSNLLLLSAQREMLDPHELYLALNESARYLRYCGVEASVDDRAAEDLPGPRALALYDTFARIVDALWPRISRLLISLSDGGLRLTADLDRIPDLPETALPVAAAVDDGLLYLTVLPEKGGAA